ncbi:hypothetical protein IQ221_08535 [Synechocystis salina LEGE 00041]|nr:hypothetical protein [Synechocystis salina LEGE 00041]
MLRLVSFWGDCETSRSGQLVIPRKAGVDIFVGWSLSQVSFCSMPLKPQLLSHHITGRRRADHGGLDSFNVSLRCVPTRVFRFLESGLVSIIHALYGDRRGNEG